MQRDCVRLFTVTWVLLCASCAMAGDYAEDLRRAVPPVLKDVRWQRLDTAYTDVHSDGSGRAWFAVPIGPPDVYSRRAKALVCSDARIATIEIPATNYIWGFDAWDRFWEWGEYGMVRTDTHTGAFRQYRASPSEKPQPGVDITAFQVAATGPVLIPLKEGGLLALGPAGVSCLYDGSRWTVSDSLKSLIEDNYQMLMKRIDNDVPRLSNGTYVSRDSQGRIWLPGANGIEAYDGGKWLPAWPRHDVRLNAAGDRCAVDAFMADTSVWPPKELARCLTNVAYSTDLVLCGPANAPDAWRLLSECLAQVRPEIPIEHAADGLLRDRSGRIWLNRWEYGVCFWAKGALSKPLPARDVLPAIAEQDKDTYWVWTGRGLIRVRGAAGQVVADTLYERLLPRGPVRWMAVDARGGLWTSFEDGVIVRVELPAPGPTKEGKP